MKVWGGLDPMTRTLLIGIGRDGEIGRVGADGWIQSVAKEPGSTIEPTLRLDIDTAHALGAFLQQHGCVPSPPDDLTPTKQHLTDAIAVRDRLLAIVERDR